ncbi:MAG: T9SS type A sorting domain-containing protein [Bacteroidia bacterium]|nr:T9SS type A sorting domain-containing protein [Bacteroidia bacterium]
MRKNILLGILLFINQIIFSQCLNGIYTIGGAVPSFTSITQAVNTLTVNGVCGPVTFNIRPGTYNEKITIPNVAGTSSLNTITFQAENGDSSSVIIQSNNGSVGNYIIRLDAARFVNIQKLSLVTTDATYSNIFYLINNTNTIKISNCLLDAPIASSISGFLNRTLISSNGTFNNGLIIENNKISGGEMGVYVGSNSNVISNVLIGNNRFVNQYTYGLYLNAVRAPQIISNHLTSNLGNTTFRNLYLASCTQSLSIEKNQIEQLHGDGIAITSHSSTAGNIARICNNKINVSGTLSSKYGIYLQTGGNFDIFHNTVVTSNTSTISACLYFGSVGDINLKNNILSNTGGGYVSTVASINSLVSDFNDLYTNGSILIYNYGNKTFSSWKALGYDVNSLNVAPQFVSSSDFHISSDFTQNWPTPFITSVPDDIEGSSRDNLSPYLGAYEYANVLFFEDADVYKVVTASLNCPGSQPAKILLRNLGANTLTTTTINWIVNGVMQTPFNWSGNLNFFDTVTVTIGSMNFSNLGTYSITAWSSLPNGVADNLPQNDSAVSPTIYTALNGIYTIGGVSPSFSNITTAVTRLKNSGICGNVIFNLRNGTYSNENFDFQSIPSLTGSNSLLIQSELGVPSSVSIICTTTANPIYLSNVSNVTFKKIRIESYGSHLLELKSGCNNIEINGCQIWNGNISYQGIRGFLTSGNVNNLRILNNEIWGSIGVQLSASAPYKFNNVKIIGNEFKESEAYILNVDTLVYSVNTATITVNGNGQWVGISSCNNILVAKNKIHSYHPASFAVALSLSTINTGTVSNNFLIGGASGVFKAYAINNVWIINNSMNCVGIDPVSVTFNYIASGSGNKIWNNVFQNTGRGMAIDLGLGAEPTTSFRNNAYYANGFNFGRFKYNEIADFSTWQALSNIDTNAIYVNAQFNSGIDLHANDISLNNAGTSVPSFVTDDFDGQVRNAGNPDIGADEFTPYTLDAGTTGFNFGKIVCFGNNNLEVKLKNNGTAVLTSAIVKCSVNGVLLSSNSWSGFLSSGTETIISFGNYNFTPGVSYVLKSWSQSPNGNNDIFKTNDTTYLSFVSPGMSGMYTIGGTSPDFITISAAVNALKSSGVCGPVVFNIRNGIYNEQIIVPNIKGTSPSNTVQFQSESLDSSSVSIQYSSFFSQTNYIINVDSADYIIFYKLGFKSLSSGYGNAITFTSKAKYAKIKNCFFEGQISSDVLITLDYTSDSVLVSNCRFYRSATSILSNASFSMIRNNIFEEQSLAGVNVAYPNFDISSNFFNYINSNCQSIAISSLASGKACKNKIIYGITTNSAVVVSNAGSIVDRILISNNFISLNGGTGIYLSSVNNVNLLHNSINQNGNGYCLKYMNVDNSQSQNNVFYNQVSYCIYGTAFTPGFLSNYNCIYSPNNLLLQIAYTNTYTNLAAYTSVTSMDGNSISANPLFISNSDLHISNTAAVNNVGIFTGDVVDDIDGEFRSTSSPDIGADEIQTAILSNVWPGDTDFDLIVTSQDLYAIGLGYGNHKYARDSISNTYIAHSSYDWWVPQVNGKDFKHADCNGDSIINMSDTLAIHLNYSLSHAPKAFSVTTGTLTDVYMIYNKSVYYEGDTVRADIMIGSATNIKTNMYGLSFKLNYDGSMVKANSEKMGYIDSWMGNINSTKIKFANISHNSGVMDASLVRITHTDVNGYGKIGTFQFVLNDTLSSGTLNLSITDANKIDHNGSSTPLVSGQDSITVDLNGVVTRLITKELDGITVFPNPASDHIEISFANTVNIKCKAELSAMDGKIVSSKSISSNSNDLNLNGLSKGIYVLKLIMEDGFIKVFKLVIQ